MTSAEHQLQEAIRRYWEGAGTDVEQAREIMDMALVDPPNSPITLARTLQVALRANAPGFESQVDDMLAVPMVHVIGLLALVDTLGDEHVGAGEAIFDHLAARVPEEMLSGLETAPAEQARIGTQTRAHAARALISALGHDRIPQPLAGELGRTLDVLEHEAQDHQARVLFVTPDHDAGLVLGVKVLAVDALGVSALDTVDAAMEKQARIVISPFLGAHPGVRWSLEWPLSYAGESIGLALHLAALVSFSGQRSDPLLAATGAVAEDGRVHHVEGVGAKLTAAREAGLRRVLLARENEAEAREHVSDGEIALLFVEHIDEVPGVLAETTLRSERSFDGRVRQARASLPLHGLSLKEEKTTQNSVQLIVTDAVGKAILNVFSGAKGKLTAAGPDGPTRRNVQALIDGLSLSAAAEPRQPHGFMLADEHRQSKLTDALEHAGAERLESTGTGEEWRYALRRGESDAQITLWGTGKGRLTGSAPAYDEILALVAAAQQGLANTNVKPKPTGPKGGSSPSELPSEGPWIGTDESGKGDYFGPLVSAAVYADAHIAHELADLGVKDSKKLSDKRVHVLAPMVRQTVGKGRFKITALNPPRYNKLYDEFKAEGKNLNSLLAWGHTRSIEDLLEGGLKPRYAIVDQFADARYIETKLLAETRQAGLQIFQFPKAETDIAVAAASILARDAFLKWLARTSGELGVTLPKGASPQVLAAAKQIVAVRGRAALADLAKLHFKTTRQVLEK
ncbi:MAG: ribonuclease HIII [Solirubrobacteraceae bacterium]